MKYVIRKSVFLFSLAWFTCISAAPERLTVHYDSFPPWLMNPGDPEYPGYIVELMKKLLPAKDFTLVWKRVNRSETVSRLQQGKYWACQIVLPVHPMELSGVLFSEKPLFYAESALFVRSGGKITVRNGEILPDGSGAMPSDWSVSDEWDLAIAKKTKQGLMRTFPLKNAADRSVSLLLNGKVRFLIGDPASVRFALLRMKKDPGTLNLWKKAGEKVPFHAAFTEKSGNAVKAWKCFNQAYGKFVLTEEYRKLRRKYALEEPENKEGNFKSDEKSRREKDSF